MRPVLSLAVLLVVATSVSRALADDPAPDVELFVKAGCPHCERATEFLRSLEGARPGLRVRVSDVVADPAARERFRQAAEEAGVPVAATPAFLVRGVLVVGWGGAGTTGARVEAALAGGEPGGPGGADPSCPVEQERTCEEEASVDLPWVGRVRLEDVGLFAFTAAVGLVDGFNPCAMWVLLFLLSLLVHLKSRTRMFAVAGTFIGVSGLVYFAFMAAWLNLFLFLGAARWIQVTLGVLAVLAGTVHVKDFFAFHRGVSLSIPAAAKPGIAARVNRILVAENLGGALLGVVALAFLVNLVELLCTAGLPAIYTKILTQQQLPAWRYYGLLALYQVFYMLDDSVMLAIAIVTLSHRRLEERGGRWLKLLSGVVMVALGVLLLVRPEWLSW